jgi:hypothetical protein
MQGAFFIAVIERCLPLGMIKKLAATAIIISLFSCSGGSKKTPVTDTDVATTFIRNILDDDFPNAEQYLVKNEFNQQYFERFRQEYHAKDKTELANYKAAEIIIYDIKPVNDSVHIVNYSNTYKKEIKNKLKMVWVNGKWLVDLNTISDTN